MPVENYRAHPSVHQSAGQWSEDQTLHIASPFTNPFRWRTRLELYEDFRRHMTATPNVRLYPIELAFGDRPFSVTDPHLHPLDIQLRTDCEMWHKENLINLAVRSFPTDWKYGGYCDGDFHFTRHDWALEAIHLLQHYDFVQLFSNYVDLTGEQSTSWTGHRPFRVTSSFAWNYLHPEEFKRSWTDRKGLADLPDGFGGSYLKKMALMPTGEYFPFGLPPGATGGAWAWRRSAFDTVGGMLEHCILGSGDWHMAFGLIEGTNVAAEMKRCTQPYVQGVLQWQQRAAKLTRNIGCVDQMAVHHFHGSKTARQYGDRWQILRQHAFDQHSDLTKDWQGVWRWSGNKPRLRDDVRRYFITRNEDDPSLKGGERVLV